MDIVVIVLGLVGLAFALLLARGMYLIGQGGEAEMQARSKAANSGVVNSGWMVLDWLRNWDSPTLDYVERKLGIDKGGDDD